MQRWRRDIKRGYTRVKINYDGWITTKEQQRFDKLCTTFERLANSVADDDEHYERVLKWLEGELKKCNMSNARSSICGVMTQLTDTPPIQVIGVNAQTSVPIEDPNRTKRKGAPRKTRQKGPIEKGKKKAKGRPKKQGVITSE
ncbi:unnamed protein product, partial [Cuscuta epithymum]